MLDPNSNAAVRLIRKLLPYTTAVTLVAVLYVAWVFYSRSDQNRRIEQEAAARRSRAAQELARISGGDKLKILSFYATPGIVARGQKTLICYGVINAKTVRIEPPFDRVTPALSQCLEFTPAKETRFTLTAEDGQGHSATESFVLSVK